MLLDIRRSALALLLLPMLVTACGSHASAARSPRPAPAPAVAPAEERFLDDAFPAPMADVPWSDAWQHISIAPDRGAVALIGPNQHTFDGMQERGLDEDVRDGRPETQALIRPGAHVLAMSPAGIVWLTAPDDMPVSSESSGSWSSDGRYFALEVAGRKIVIADTETRGWRPLAQLSLFDASDPVFSPDGKEVAFAETRWSIGEDESRRGRSDVGPTSGSLQVVDLDGRALRHATLESLPEWPRDVRIAWSPDGQWLAVAVFHSPYDLGEGIQLRIHDASSLQLIDAHFLSRQAASGFSLRPQWSPDSRRIVLGTVLMLGIVDISGSGAISRVRENEKLPAVKRVCWSPSGQRVLAFTERRTPDLREGIEVLMGAGHARTHVTTYETWLVDPDSGTVEAQSEFRHVGRESWHAPWMIPRVAEAFALWSR